MADADLSLGERLAAAGARRYARWDPDLWQQVLDGPASMLAEGLEASEHPLEASRAVLEAYLTLAAEAVGLGYLYPAGSSGRANFFNMAWTELLPPRLPTLSPQRQGEVLAACWNLGENLETLPGWVQRVMMALLQGLDDLEDFENVVAEVAEAAFEPPGDALQDRSFDIYWVHLAADDPLFLPGWVEFIAPSVVCVHDRQKGLDGQPRRSVAVWLTSPPRVLGALRVAPDSEDGSKGRDSKLWQAVADLDPRLTTTHATVRNDWRAAATLETSQFLVALVPPAAQEDA